MALVNERFQVKSFPTAITKDLLFYEVHDSVLPKNKQPEYGTPHPNHQTYPNHVLTYIEAREEEGKQNWYYAAKRETQDLYNWEFSEADLGGTRFPSVNRTYIILRDEFDSEAPAQGAVMANAPEDVFDGTYVLSSRVQKRSEKELDSVFVVEQHTYVKKSIFSDVIYDEKTGRGDRNATTLYYSSEIVTGDLTAAQLFLDETNPFWGLQADGAFRRGKQVSAEWYQVDSQSVIPANAANTAGNPAKKRVITRVTPLGTDVLFVETGAMPSPEPEYGSAHYDSGTWPDHKLVLIKPSDASGLLYDFYYAADRENQDLYNWEHSKANIGGQQFDSVKRIYLTLRAEFNPSLPMAGSPMENVPSGVFEFFDDYVLADRIQTRTNEPELDSIYVTETRVYVRKTTQRQTDYDEQFGKPLFTTQTLYFASEIVTGTTVAAVLFASTTNPFWGLQSNGYMREGKQLSTNWYVITERQVIPTALVTSGRSYTTTVDFSWPAVLSNIAVDTWNRKDGGYEQYVRPIYSVDAYNGSCKALVTETFHVTAPTSTAPTEMKPLPINISTPLFSVSIGPTLHAAYNLVITTGTNHPTYESTVASYSEPATVPTTRPASVVASDTIQPFRGGFLRKLITVYAP